MNRRQRGESLSERLRSEVQVSAALWQIGPSIDENSSSGEAKAGGISRRSSAYAPVGNVRVVMSNSRRAVIFMQISLYVHDRVKTGIRALENGNNGGSSANSSSQRKLKVNLPLTVVCERANAQEMMLWLRTDAQGNVLREEKTPLWRKKLHHDLVGAASASAANPANGHENDPVLAVRSCSLKNTEAPEDVDNTETPSIPAATGSTNGLSASTMAAVNAAFEAAMAAAAQISRFYCVTVSPDARACARWPKLRGAAIAEGVLATSRIVEHVQMQLPALRFHSMTTDFIKDTSGVWWLTRVVDFKASSLVEPPRDEGCFSTRDSAVLIPEALRRKPGMLNHEPQADEGDSPPRESMLMRGDELNNVLNTRACFLCNCSCELAPTFRGQLEAMLKGQNGDDYKENNSMVMETLAIDDFRMTLTMALDTIFLMRQRGVILPVWENAVSTVRKSQLRDVCDFPVCMLCYRVYQQQNRLQLIARELHNVFSPSIISPSERPEVDDAINNGSAESTGIGMATSAASGLASSQLLSTELRLRHETPKNVLDLLEAFQTETMPPALLLRGDSPEMRPTWSILTPMRGADVDPTATQLRLVFFFHELQDAGPDLVPTDFFLEYQLGQNVTRVQLEGSKHHTPNRWQLCEARVHYLCASLDAFSDLCSQKRLLMKMKAKPSSPNQTEKPDSAAMDLKENAIDEHDEHGIHLDGGSPSKDQNRHRDKEEFFGYALLSLRSVITAAKWFGNSLQPESRTDYLLELHTTSSGLLTLKLTVGLLVDPVPLGHVRDVLRDRIFLEEQPPRGVYWPPPSHCLSGLAIPRDWVGALMPSEYTKILPMRRREAPTGHTGVSNPRYSHSHSHSQTAASVTAAPGPRPLTRRNSSDLMEKTVVSASTNIMPGGSRKRRMSNLTLGKNWAQTARELASSGATSEALAAGLGVSIAGQVQEEYRSHSLHLMTVAMIGTTLSRACLAAKRIVFRITEDAATNRFPTVLLAVILRHASFANPVSNSCFSPVSSSNWKSPARFHFTRRYSVDRLLAEVKPGSLPMLALLAELLLVLIEDRVLPERVDASALEPLLDPFWHQDNGWRPIPRTRTTCLPERRVIWNRAIRRWEAASGIIAENDETLQSADKPEVTSKPVIQSYASRLATDIGDFRAKVLALVLCELFEHMETLDNGYIEIAELRSLAKCLPNQEGFGIDEQLDEDVGTRERLSKEDIAGLAGLVEQQRRLAVRTLLHSLMESSVMIEALARFDRVGSGEMSLEGALGACVVLSFHEQLLRKLMTSFEQYQADKSPSKPSNSPEKSPDKAQTVFSSSADNSAVVDAVQAARDAARRFSDERMVSKRNIAVDFSMKMKHNPDPASTRRASSPPRLERLRRLSSGKVVLEEVPDEKTEEPGFRRRRAVAGRAATTRQMVDAELESMLSRLHAAERTIVMGEVQGNDRKLSVSTARTRQSGETTQTENAAISKISSCSDLKGLVRSNARKSTSRAVSAQNLGPVDASVKAAKRKKRVKKKILRKTARRLRSTTPLPTSASLSKLLRLEFTDRNCALTSSASETIIEKAVRVEEKRKQVCLSVRC
ncbi:unnamed protein product [Phytophthora lilii]|uniref:Unnamed protein product n=1 Tax=Phytophthora lilii TaxID=2077276 RepID=A0A9W6X0R5_9STRA|nr:unnamed protein product [Phytophthora lilii]